MRYRWRSCLAPILLCAMFLGVPVNSPANAADPGLSDGQKQAVRELIREHLLENPEIVYEALKIIEERRHVAEQERQRKAIDDALASMNGDPYIPVGGNAKGDVTVVEFFDYNCGYCRRAADGLRRAMSEDQNLRVRFIELPILGQESVVAARAALAAKKQNKYLEFHFAMMTAPGRASSDKAREVARRLGLDVKRLEDDMKSPEIDKALQRNLELAENLNVRGTPAFVVGTEFVPGAVSIERLRQLVDAARKG